MTDALAMGGAERQAILCVSELQKLGHSVDLVYYRPTVEYGAMLDSLGIRPIYVPARNFFERCRRLHALFLKQRYDVVHGFKMAAEVYTAIAGTWAGVPAKFGAFQSIYNVGPKLCAIHFAVDKLLTGWIVNSEAGAESIARRAHIAPRKIVVLHNGIGFDSLRSKLSPEAAKRSLGIAETSPVVTMVARLIPSKNHRMLIDCASIVQKAIRDVRFIAVGKGSLREELEAYAADRNLTRSVTFLGERHDIAEILAATDVSVLTTDFEGLPNVIVEAMAARRPIACTDYCGYSDLMRHEETALISPCRDPAAFAANLIRLLGDKSLRERLANNGFCYAQEHFSPRTMALRLEGFYRQLGSNIRKSDV